MPIADVAVPCCIIFTFYSRLAVKAGNGRSSEEQGGSHAFQRKHRPKSTKTGHPCTCHRHINSEKKHEDQKSLEGEFHRSAGLRISGIKFLCFNFKQIELNGWEKGKRKLVFPATRLSGKNPAYLYQQVPSDGVSSREYGLPDFDGVCGRTQFWVACSY